MGSNKKEKAFWAEATVERPISEVCAHGFGWRIKTAGCLQELGEPDKR